MKMMRAALIVVAAVDALRVLPFWGKGLVQREPSSTSVPETMAAEELFELCANAAAYVSEEDPRASELVDELCAEATTIDVEALGGGLWVSKYTRGPKPRWRLDGNKAGQTYFPESREVENYAELLGRALYFVARGTYEPRGGAKKAPVDVDVSICKGGLVVFGYDVEVPIRGPGLLRIHYLDDRIRIFESPTASSWEGEGLFVVQVKQSALADYQRGTTAKSSSS